MACVYWIHLPEHTDMFSEGYIGFTSKTTEERYKFHLYKMRANKDNLPLYNAMRKYLERVVVETLCICEDAYGLWLENRLRPLPNTGWNSAAGGDTPHNKGRKYNRRPPSCSTKAKLSAASLSWWKAHGKEHTFVGPPAPKKVPKDCLLEYMKNCPREPWLRPTANVLIWYNADALYEAYLVNGAVGRFLPSGERFNGKTITRWFEDGWRPKEDPSWTEWKERRRQNVTSII